VKKLEKTFGKNKKAISTILAALLMVVIVVVASVMVYAWSTGLLGGLLVTPTAGKENLTMDANAYSFPSSTAVSISIRNIGSVSTQLVSYYVTDSSGNTWSNTNWVAGPTILVNQVNVTRIDIVSPAMCSSSPCGFTTFTAGSYTVKVVTSRNNPFTFNILK